MKQIIALIFCASIVSNLSANSISDSLIIEGKNLFRNNCKACHNIDKKIVGPALSKVYERRDSVWMYNFIKGSQKMIADGDPIANELYQQYNEIIMPDQKLNDEQIGLVINYIKNTDNTKTVANTNPISRPIIIKKAYSDHFRFSNYLFWIPFTLSIILGVFVLYFLTHYYEIVEDHFENIHHHNKNS